MKHWAFPSWYALGLGSFAMLNTTAAVVVITGGWIPAVSFVGPGIALVVAIAWSARTTEPPR